MNDFSDAQKFFLLVALISGVLAGVAGTFGAAGISLACGLIALVSIVLFLFERYNPQ